MTYYMKGREGEQKRVQGRQKRDFVQRLASLGRGWDSLSVRLGPARVV